MPLTLAQINTALRQANEFCGRPWDETDVPTEAYAHQNSLDNSKTMITCIVRGEWVAPGMYRDVREKAAEILGVHWIGVFIDENLDFTGMTRLPDA